MDNIFSGKEIVELGIQIEKNGRDFYNTLIKQSKNENVQGIFQYLACEEEKHIAVFQMILDSANEYRLPEAYSEEYFAYMNALASNYVFTREAQGEKVAKKITDDKEAIDVGIGFEKDSIVFYEGMKKVVPEYDGKTVDELIAQEQNHLRQLNEVKLNIGVR